MLLPVIRLEEAMEVLEAESCRQCKAASLGLCYGTKLLQVIGWIGVLVLRLLLFFAY